MAGPAEIVTDVWQNAQALATAALVDAEENLDAAVNVAGTTAPQVVAATFGFSPNVVEPNVEIPVTAEAAGFVQFMEIWETTIADLTTRFRDFILEYFPDETPYINSTQIWIDNAIANGGTGLKPYIEDQIWQRERTRLTKESLRAEDTVLGTWAARGFPLPPGAAAHAVRLTQQDTRDKIAESSSKVAIAQAELEQKNVQFAVEHAIKLWTGAMNAASDYIKAIATGPNSAGAVLPSITDSQSKLIQAANSYYTSRIAVEELRMKSQLPTSQWAQEVNVKNGDLVMAFIKEKVNAAVEAARVSGTIAASSLNSLHASAAISGSDSTNYNYNGEV